MSRPSIFITAALGAALISTPAPAQHLNAACPYVVEDRTTRWELSTDGTGRVTTRTRFRVENEDGAWMLGQLREPYLVSRSRPEVLDLTVRHPDGSRDGLRPEHVRDLPAPALAAFPVYTDLRMLQITPPALRPGDLLELTMLREIVHLDTPGHFRIEHSFIPDAVVESESLEISVPAETPVQLCAAEGLEPEVEYADEHRVYRWTRRQDQVDATTAEAFDPRALIKRPQIELASYSDSRPIGNGRADGVLHTGVERSGASLLRVLDEIEEIEVLTSALQNMAEHGHQDQIDPLLERLEELAPDGRVHHELGTRFAHRGRYADARFFLERAAELFPGEFPDQDLLDYVRRQQAGSV